MKAYSELSREELMELREQLLAAYEEKKALGLNLDMSRGKPSPTQLGVSVGLMDVINSDSDMKSECGIDCRNYGCLDGIPEVKRLMAEMMGTIISSSVVTQVLLLCLTLYQEHIHME